MKYCRKTSLGDRLLSNAVVLSHRKAVPVCTSLASKKGISWRAALTQVRFCCFFSCQILLESFCLMRDYSAELLPVLLSPVKGTCHILSAVAVTAVVSWSGAGGRLPFTSLSQVPSLESKNCPEKSGKSPNEVKS